MNVSTTSLFNVSLVRHWGRLGATSVLDQVVLSGTNFAVNILLARWMTPEEYGAFAIAFTALLFLSGFQNATILEPMSVLGPAKYANIPKEYYRAQLMLHLILTSALAILLLLVGWVVGLLFPERIDLREALFGAGIALPFILLLWLIRRFQYLRRRPSRALWASLRYLAFVGIGFAGAYGLGAITPFTGFVIMGGASLLAAVPVLWRLGSRGKPHQNREENGLLAIAREQWRYGRWIAAAGFLNTASGQLQIIMVGFIGLAEAGTFRAMQNFMLPMTQVVTSISVLTLPALSADFGRGQIGLLRKKGLLVAGILTGLAVAYEAVLILFGVPLEGFLYGGKYAEFVQLLPILGLVPVAASVAAGFSLILRAEQWPQHVLYLTFATGGIGLVSSVVLISRWGVLGAAMSLALTYAAGAGLALLAFWWWTRHNPVLPHTSADGEDLSI